MGERKRGPLALSGFMDRARELAERGRYTAAPNPVVGAVVVRDGVVVGEGWHARAGGPHAEPIALDAAGERSRGADLYVTLEPCNHQGRTPPCTNAILRAGISRVVVGHLDADPRMRGRSVALLREAGVEVEVLEDARLARQNEQFLRSMATGRPFVHVKLASTLDGRIAAANGESKWITGEAARKRAHELRAEAGCVLVGAGTARADDPLLLPRDLDGEPPRMTRAVLDPNLTLDPKSQLARTASDESPVLVFALDGASGELDGALRRTGVEVVPTPGSEGVLDLGFVLDELGRRGVRGVLVEGGGETAGRFVEAGLADKLTLFFAPKFLGAKGAPLLGSFVAPGMADVLRYDLHAVERFGSDFAAELYPMELNAKGGGADVHGSDRGDG